jgi:hypothetical protein
VTDGVDDGDSGVVLWWVLEEGRERKLEDGRFFYRVQGFRSLTRRGLLTLPLK